MPNSKIIIDQFADECTGCGLCVQVCPIVSDTELKRAAPEAVMEEVLDLFRNGKIGDLARTRIYSCLFCNTCVATCPQGLKPGLAFGMGKGLLRELGDRTPKGVAGIMALGETLLGDAIPSFRKRLDHPDQLITSIGSKKPSPVKTVLFASCFGLIEGWALHTTLKILERIDPRVCILGGYDYCCGELQFMAGKPDEAYQQFERLVSGLNSLSPAEVVMFCPTCQMTFDHHHPSTSWSWTFITDFIVRHLDKLGPLREINRTVTVHDPCHYVRGIDEASDSPRKILSAIPGIRIREMKNSGENTLCCGAYAITGTGKPGYNSRARRLQQAKDTGADLLSLYCPGCHMTLRPEAGNMDLRIESILTLLGKSLGIEKKGHP